MDFHWYLPSMYGDVKLERLAESSTKLVLNGLSPTEKEAVRLLFKRASKSGPMKKLWATAESLAAIDLDSMSSQSVDLAAPISTVQNFLQKSLKPHRKQISAVTFTNGRIEQVTEATLQLIDSPAVLEEKKEEPKPKPKAAVTVAQPTLGCPAPDFDDVEVRANRVLRTFLSPAQIEDFERRQQFIAVGADTGHRYLLTSRHSKHGLKLASYRLLFDIDEQNAFCVHDWEVPAAEELLGLFVHISLPGLERYVRNVPDCGGVLDW